MTTISHNRRKNRQSLPSIAIAALFIIVIAIVGIWRTQVSSLFWKFASPLVSFRNTLDATDNARLRAELAQAQAASADRDALYQENALIKAQFGRNVGGMSTLAGVLLSPPNVPYDTLLIDAGTREGIVKGSLVYAGGTTFIGTVDEAYDTSARVLLISAPGRTYQAFINNQLAISIEGQGAGSMRGEVPVDSTVAVGDTIALPGIALQYVGTVSYVDAKPGESFKTVYMHLPVDYFNLRFVEVRPPHQTP